MTALYHRTCRHVLEKLEVQSLLTPQPHALLGYNLVWLTSLPSATREQLGLSSHSLSCDRMEHLLRVDEGEGLIPWNVARNHMPLDGVRALEAAKGTLPACWWVGTHPLTFELVS
jgi:hypothetical protein